MPVEIISIVGLVVVFLLATLRSVNMGAVAFLAVFVLGTFLFGKSADDLFAGFPGDLFTVLVGVTLLFGIAKHNGTVDWLINMGVRAVRGHIALVPWVMFLVTSVLTMAGAVVPGAVAIMAPIGLNFAVRHRINPMLMGLLIINGASAGGFSPISIFGTITNGVVSKSDLPGSPVTLWLGSFVFNALLSVVVFFLFGGRTLLGRKVSSADDDAEAADDETVTGTVTLNWQRVVTIVGLLVLTIGSLAFELDTGMLAIGVATVICLIAPKETKGAVTEVAWPTVLLICGVVTYVGMMEELGTIDYLGHSVAAIGAPLLAAFVICLIGGGVSAFASTTGILGALIPLAVPFLQGGTVNAVAMITALAISSSVVDSSPFSTSGALVVANTPEEHRQRVFRGLMAWGMSMIVVAPALTWLIFILPGW